MTSTKREAQATPHYYPAGHGGGGEGGGGRREWDITLIGALAEDT